MNRVLVTGATGTVGADVARGLRDRGAAVRAFTRDPDRAAAILGDGVELAAGDLGEPGTIQVALKGVDQVFLASPNAPLQFEWETNVVDAVVASSARRIVKLSAVGAAVGSPLQFWDAHGRVEEHLRKSEVPSVILRPTFYMSNLLAAVDTIRQAGQFFLPAADARVAMVDPGDVAAVAATVITRDGDDGKIYRLTGPEPVTFSHVAEQLSAAIGRPVQFVDVPDRAAREAMVGSGMSEWVADNLVTLFGFIRAGVAEATTDDVRAVLGRAPHGFADFARDHVSLFAVGA
jgi:uncharacterized protein YbjT (DUF2867 family)